MPELTAREALLLLAADLETIADHSLDSGSYGHAAAMARGRASALAETAREPVPVQPGTEGEERHTGALRAAVDAALSALRNRWPDMTPALAAEDATIAIGAAEPLIRADERERIARLADENGAAYTYEADVSTAPDVPSTETRWRPFADLIREMP